MHPSYLLHVPNYLRHIWSLVFSRQFLEKWSGLSSDMPSVSSRRKSSVPYRFSRPYPRDPLILELMTWISCYNCFGLGLQLQRSDDCTSQGKACFIWSFNHIVLHHLFCAPRAVAINRQKTACCHFTTTWSFYCQVHWVANIVWILLKTVSQ